MERINLTDTDVQNFIEDRNWGENTRRQNEWRINQIISSSKKKNNDFSNLDKYSWFPGLYKHLKIYSDKKKVVLDNDVKIINLQKELEIYKKNMSLEEIKATTQLLTTINNINNKPKVIYDKEVYGEDNGEDKDYDRIRNKYIKEKRVREEQELQHKEEKDKLLVKVEKYQQMAIKYQKLYEDLLSTQNQKKNYSSDEDQKCGYN